MVGVQEMEGLLPGTEKACDCSGGVGSSVAGAAAAGAYVAGASVAGAFDSPTLKELLSPKLSKGIGPFRPSLSHARRA